MKRKSSSAKALPLNARIATKTQDSFQNLTARLGYGDYSIEYLSRNRQLYRRSTATPKKVKA